MKGKNKLKPAAVVYTSNTGHTEQYARLLGNRTGLPIYAFREAENQLGKETSILYLGWLHASYVKGFRQAEKRFSVCAVCGVGLCDTGTMIAEVRKATAIPEDIPLFTLKGGIDRGRLKGLNKLMICMLTWGLAAQEKRSEQEERMLSLLQTDASYVREGNLTGILEWYEKESVSL